MSAGTITQFYNCTILRDHVIQTEDLWVRDGKIINPEQVFFDEKVVATKKVDCGGTLIAPGFIDLQINGGFGIDFSHNTSDIEIGLAKVAQGLLAHGVTSFCPTVVTSKPDIYRQVLPKLKRRQGGRDGATILGVHLEGPFISKQKKGAHDEDAIASLSEGPKSLIDVYGHLDNASIVTLAPELPGADEAIQWLTKQGITVSLGHSMANLQEGVHAVNQGATFITHLFNAMLPFHHRDPGLVGLLSSDMPDDRTVFYGIISDGVHTHPAALRIAYRVHPKGIVLVTDAISPLGLEAGTHNIGQMMIEIRDQKAFIAGTDTLCGSIASMNDCVKHFKAASGCSTAEAIEAATLHPAQVLGIQKQKGTLNFGADADFVMLDPENLLVLSTFIAGECVYVY
ncbi:N-acetylglucosamine-6-phosphate deacetylase [Frankliniella fusca]|uniref:N-acetylglucosamine-6-phosphate deacetylase n=1 Tax=Frankliniella fusca TaxID=407009 RepID=A0AAE1HYH0_9NEOP|nr:N-acetylglucosamine-6-phosphate deacetylase [Frankliniella fusca]